MKLAISKHNASIKKMDNVAQVEPRCNCRGGSANCPVGGQCQRDKVIYRAAVTDNNNNTEYYTGLTSRKFKKRWYEHRNDTTNLKKRHATSLSNHIWTLKEENMQFTTEWSLMDRAPPFNPISRKCRLCLKEKLYIMYRPENATHNKRSENFSTCRHRLQGLLVNK